MRSSRASLEGTSSVGITRSGVASADRDLRTSGRARFSRLICRTVIGAFGPSTIIGEALRVDRVSGLGGWETGWAKASDALVGILKAASTFNCSLNCL